MGDIIGDLNKRRGRVLGMERVGKKQVIEAEVPQAEMFTYPADLRPSPRGAACFPWNLPGTRRRPRKYRTRSSRTANCKTRRNREDGNGMWNSAVCAVPF
ncbi:MAG: hypothetical protein ACLR23_17885 [Clostridia bacterium]